MQKVSEVLREGVAVLQAAEIPGAARDARILMAHVLEIDTARVTLHLADIVGPAHKAQFLNLIDRRAKFQPVSQIVGHRMFWGREFLVTPDVLDPRPETEEIIVAALEHPSPERLLDLGTGSGILAVTLLAEWPEVTGVATDVSQPALHVAEQNAVRAGVDQRLTLQTSDWFTGVEGQFDLIVSNPPYISTEEMTCLSRDVHEWEPHLALTPGGDGLGAYRVIAVGVTAAIKPGGRLLLEIGLNQASAVCDIFATCNAQHIRVRQDMSGHDRVIEVKFNE